MASSPTTPKTTTLPAPRFQGIPPLENGDRLTRAEFERRYNAMPHIHKAELIEGVVHMPSPVRVTHHGEPHMNLTGWLVMYRVYTPLVRGGISSTIRLDLDNEPQPDGILFLERPHGGRAFIDADGYITGSPELAAEVTASTASIDLGNKLNAYRRNEIREYLVWRVLEQAIDWFVLRQGKYERLPLSSAGYFQSEVFPGLWLDAAALINNDLMGVQEAIMQGVQSSEHAAFLARLRPVPG